MNLREVSIFQVGDRIRYRLQEAPSCNEISGVAEIEVIYSSTYAVKGWPYTVYPNEVLGLASPFAPPPEHRADVRPGPRTL